MRISSSNVQLGHLKFLRPYVVLWSLVLVGMASALSNHPLVLIVSFDGFRYDYLDNETMRTPNLDSLMADGVRAPWVQPRYITKTLPNHFSISTGMHEESHGIVANWFFDPVLNGSFSMTNVDPKFWDVGGLPLWVLNQMAAPDRYSGGMMWPGTDVPIRNQTTHHQFSYNTSVTWNERVDIVIDWFKHETEPANLVYLYFEDPDNTSHWYGPSSAEVVQAVEMVDRNVGYLKQRLQDAGLYDTVNLIVTSDHGMTDIPKENNLFMSDFVNVSMFRAFGGTPVWTILPNEGLEDELYDILVNASKYYHFSVYKKENIPEAYHYRHNRRVMPILISMDEHYNLNIRRNGSAPPNTTTGNHGYDNKLMSMQVIFVARGPQFKRGYVSEPFDNIDIFPLGCHLLGIEPSANNATMNVVKNLLRSYPVGNLDDKIFAVLSVVLFVSFLAALFAIVRIRMKMPKVQKRKVRERIPSNMFDEENIDAAEEDHRLLVEQ